jgi:hypothetical protein
MRVKVQDGTPQHGGPSLCLSCRKATVLRGSRLGDEEIHCSELWQTRKPVPFPVRSCSAYSDRRQPSLRDMEDLAWVLRTDSKHSRIGFVQARKLDPEERHVLSDDDWTWRP